jgi:hypothetical protein
MASIEEKTWPLNPEKPKQRGLSVVFPNPMS